MKYWKKPKDEHIVYEALTALADNRIEITEKSAKCFSSSGNKFYTINFDLEKNAFMSDDNMAYYRDEVSYPILAVLLVNEVIKYDQSILNYLKNIPWKNINQKNKNNYMKSVKEVLENIKQDGGPIKIIEIEVKKIFEKLNEINLVVMGEKIIPSNKY